MRFLLPSSFDLIVPFPPGNVKSFLALFAFLLKKVLFCSLRSPYLFVDILHTLSCCILSLESALQGWLLMVSLSLEVVECPFFHHEVLEA